MKRHGTSNAAVIGVCARRAGMLPANNVGSCWMMIYYLLTLIIAACALTAAAAEFEPYELNGGLVTAVAGKDFCILATDTRMFNSGGYNLASRYHVKCRLWSVLDDTILGETIEKYLRDETQHVTANNHERAKVLPDISKRFLVSSNGGGGGVSSGGGSSHNYKTTTATTPSTSVTTTQAAVTAPTVMIGSAGCSTDCEQLKRIFRSDLRAAIHYGNVMSSASSGSSSSGSTSLLVPDQIATLLSQTLYSRRGFPYYSFCVIAGVDVVSDSDTDNGIGKAYVYDAIGSYEQVAVASAGTGREALQPILDRAFKCSTTSSSSRSNNNNNLYVDGTADEAIDTLYHAYQSVSEREIGVGDTLVLCITEKTKGEKNQQDDDDSTTSLLQRRVVLLPLKEH